MFIDKRNNALGAYRGNFFMVSKELIKKYGMEIATFIEILIHHQDNLLNKGLIDRETGQFYVQSDKIEEISALNYKQQWNMFKILRDDFKLVKIDVFGIPPKKYITIIDFDVFDKLVKGEIIIEKHLHVCKPKKLLE